MPIRKVTPNLFQTRIIPTSVDKENRTIEVTWGTENPVRRFDYWKGEEFDEILGMTDEETDLKRLNNGAPVLDNHNWYGTVAKQQIGVVEKAWFEDGVGKATLRFSKKPEAEVVWQDIVDGIVRNISFMYKVHKYRDITPPGADVLVYRAIKTEVFEISIVTIPADPDAGIRSMFTEKQAYEVEIINQTKQEINMPPENEVIPAAAQPKDQEIDTQAIKAAAMKEERARAKKIRTAVKVAGLDEKFAEALVDDEAVTFEVASERIFSELEKKSAADSLQNVVVTHEPDKGEGVREAMAHSMLVRHSPDKYQHTEKSRIYRGYSQLELGRKLLELRGVRTDGMTKSEIARRTLASSDFGFITTALVGKTLRKAYESAGQTFWPFVRRSTLPDFKEVSRGWTSAFSDLLPVAEGKEYEEGIFTDGQEKYKVAKYGRLISITEESFVNDDVDAMLRLPGMLGSAAARKETAVLYAILTGAVTMADNVALFHADHANLGSALAVGDTGFQDAFLKLGSQKDPSGKEALNLAPQHIVVGVANRAPLMKALAAVTAGKTSDVNIYGGLNGIVDASIPGNMWFAIGNKEQCDTLELGYLEGEEGPTITEQAKFDSDVLQLKVRHIFGAKAIDYRNMYRNPGT